MHRAINKKEERKKLSRKRISTRNRKSGGSLGKKKRRETKSENDFVCRRFENTRLRLHGGKVEGGWEDSVVDACST